MSPGRKVFHRRRIPRREGLAFVVSQNAAFAAGRLGKQNAELVEPGWVELIELHVHQRDAAAIGNRDSVASASHGIRGDLEDTSKATSGNQDRFGMQHMDLAGLYLACDDPATFAVFGKEHIQQEVFVEEIDVVFDALLVQRLDDHVTGAVGGEAGSHDGSLAEVAGVTAEPALVDQSFGRAVERQAHVLEVDDRVDGLLREDLRPHPGQPGSRHP